MDQEQLQVHSVERAAQPPPPAVAVATSGSVSGAFYGSGSLEAFEARSVALEAVGAFEGVAGALCHFAAFRD